MFNWYFNSPLKRNHPSSMKTITKTKSINLFSTLFVVITLSSLVLTACGKKDKTASGSGSDTLSSYDLTYSNMQKQVFSNCTSCHSSSNASGGVALDSYALVVSHMSGIEFEVIQDKGMPPSGPLSDSRIKLLSDWIAAGSPEN
jgi:uncharacterized membrane protein